MGIEVETVITCDRCGHWSKQPGTSGDCLPEEWATLSLVVRHKGEVRTAYWGNIDAVICPMCVVEMLQAYTKGAR